MNAPVNNPSTQHITDLFNAQRKAYALNPLPSASERIDRLKRLRKALQNNTEAICKAVSDDFADGRAHAETKFAEIITMLDHIDAAISELPKWMKAQKRRVNLTSMPAKAKVEVQPLGVVGIMSPWNYPLALSVGPLISALAAGNHAMLKVSSASANLGALLEKLFADIFPLDTVAVINGGGSVSDTFCALPFDLICFTGSPNIGKTVMAAAAQNLTPVILELGGKSPALVHDSVSLKDAAERLSFGKFWNAGQTCIAPDYVLLPQGKTAEFIMEMTSRIKKTYPTLRNNPDYTSVVNDKQYVRIQKYLADAKEKGAEVITINPRNEDFTGSKKIPPTLVTNTTADMLLSQEEIFGPVLPIIEYSHISEAIAYINARPRPLALYYFDYDETRAQYIIEHTHSGHVGINVPLAHFVQEDLPFGGIGNSGMGKLHGYEGFMSMSHNRSVLSSGKIFPTLMITPPFGTTAQKVFLATKLK